MAGQNDISTPPQQTDRSTDRNIHILDRELSLPISRWLQANPDAELEFANAIIAAYREQQGLSTNSIDWELIRKNHLN